MRIVGGQFRGKALSAVGKGDAGAHLRPTTDRVRENIFNILAGGRLGDPVTGAICLDLFAGTGALGLEALSRGAAHVTFVDQGRKAAQLISANIKLLGVGDQTRMIKADATRQPISSDTPFDLIFLDPPYGRQMGEKALQLLLQADLVAENATIVWEENAPQTALPGLDLVDTRRYGDTHATFLKASGLADLQS